MKYRILLYGLINFLTYPLYSQNLYNVTILTNPEIVSDKLVVRIDDGKEEKTAHFEVMDSAFQMRGAYYGEYAQVTLMYTSAYNNNFFESSTFFIQDKPAIIKLKKATDNSGTLNNYSLKNAWDFSKDKKEMKRYDSAEVNRLRAFANEHGSNAFKDSLLFEKFLLLEKQAYEKSLEYIINNTKSYYAFSFFKRNFARSGRISSDSILAILDKFPSSFKYNEEGNIIRNLATGRKNVRVGNIAPIFSATDIEGKLIDLGSILQKGPVLLNFWATWCAPCVEEMPVISAYYKKYRDKGLSVISIAYPSSQIEKYLKAIKNLGMNWINIYDNIDVINVYGGGGPIPQVYLINQDGKIIYSRDEIESNDPGLLNSLLEKVFEKSL